MTAMGILFGDEVLILVANLLRSSFGSQHRVFFALVAKNFSSCCTPCHSMKPRMPWNISAVPCRITTSTGW